jgi:protein phosphatase
MTQLTKDHSLTQALVDAGTISADEAAHHRYRNVLWRYLGTKEGGAKVDAQVVEPRPGDRFLLCSDGVCDGVDDESLCRLLAAGDDPQETAEEVVAAAERGGSRDNITCVVVFVS